MAARAARHIQTAAGSLAALRPLDQTQYPRHLVGIHIEPSGGRIESRATPLAAAIESRKDDGALDTGRHELSRAADVMQALEDGAVGFGSPVSDHVIGEDLAREG